MSSVFDRALTDHEQIDALLTSEFLRRAAVLLEPERAPTKGGRPRAHAVWIALVFDALICVLGSARKVEAELIHTQKPWLARRIEEAAREMFDSDGCDVLRRPDLVTDPRMRRQQYVYYMHRFILPRLDEIRQLQREFSVEVAMRAGIATPETSGGVSHPSPSNVLFADGKVFKSMHKPPRRVVSKETGEVRTRRFDPDAEFVPTGGESDPQIVEILDGQTMPELHPADGTVAGTSNDQDSPHPAPKPKSTNWAHGHPFVFTHVRGDGRNMRVILDFERAPRAGGEMKHAMAALVRTVHSGLTLDAVAYDAAARGKHRADLYNHGIQLIAPPVAAANGENAENNLGPHTLNHVDGTKTQITIVTVAQLPRLLTHDVNGNPILHPLTRTKTQVRRNKSRPIGQPGAYTWYAQWKTDDGSHVWIRLSPDAKTPHDTQRAEHISSIPRGDPDYPAAYGRRNDAESHHRQIDDAMTRERLPMKGESRVTAHVHAWQWLQNAQTDWLCRMADAPQLADGPPPEMAAPQAA